MTLLGINYLNASITALVVIYVFVCLLMILLVLMQRPKQEGLGAAFGANTTDQLFGARTTNVLQRGTVYMAVLFFVLTLTLAILVQKRNTVTSLVSTPGETPAVEETTPETTGTPVTVKPGENITVEPGQAPSAVTDPAAVPPVEAPPVTPPPSDVPPVTPPPSDVPPVTDGAAGGDKTPPQ